MLLLSVTIKILRLSSFMPSDMYGSTQVSCAPRTHTHKPRPCGLCGVVELENWKGIIGLCSLAFLDVAWSLPPLLCTCSLLVHFLCGLWGLAYTCTCTVLIRHFLCGLWGLALATHALHLLSSCAHAHAHAVG